MTAKFPFIPEQAGYSVDHANEVVSVRLKGGASRTRADITGATHNVSATWLLDRVDYQVFLKFMNVTTLRGSVPFLADLIIDFWAPTQYKCLMVPGSMKTTRVEGFSYRVSMDLEVEQVTGFFVAAEKFDDPNEVFFTGTPAPLTFLQLFAVTDSCQIVGAQLNDGVHPVINLDGIYVISAVTANRLTFTSPSAINPDWSLLASYPSGITGLIDNVALINVPT